MRVAAWRVYLAPSARVVMTAGQYDAPSTKGRGAVCVEHCEVDFDGEGGSGWCGDADHVETCRLHETDRCRECIPGKRAAVLDYQSGGSRRRMLEYLAAAHRTFIGGYLVTLTYGAVWPHPDQVKRDLHVLSKRYARWSEGSPAFWLLEAQKRGAPHFHLLVTGVASRDEMRGWFRQAWLDITGYGGSSPEARLARAVDVRTLRGMGGALGYLAKEMSKRAQKRFPLGTGPGRWWGSWAKRSFTFDEPDIAHATKERMARCAAANDLWDTWGGYWDEAKGRWVDVMRTFWTGDVATWIIWGSGDLRGPPRTHATA